MKITRIESDGLGPLGPVDWSPGDCEVIFDDNQQGKTTLIDIVINTLFKERMKLFESRYDSYEHCRVEVDLDGETQSFGEDGGADRLSELLEWDMPELHRFLCIRASDLTLSRPLSSKGPEEIWKALSSVMSGMNQDYLEGIQRNLRNKAGLTKKGKWSNRGSEGLRDRINSEVVPDLERAERAEDRLRELMECRREQREARSRREQFRSELSSIEDEFNTIERKRVRAELERADEVLGEIRTLRHEIDDNYGDRITESFREPWADTKEALSSVNDKLEDWQRARELQQQVESLNERIESVKGELNEAQEEFRAKKEQFLDTRRNEIRSVYRTFSETRASKEQWLPVLEWSTPGMGLSGALLIVGTGIGFIEWIPGLIIAGSGLLGLVALGALIGYRRSLDGTLRECEDRVDEYITEWPQFSDEDPGTVLETLMDVSVEDVYPDLADRVESLKSDVQSLEGERNAHRQSLDELLDDLGASDPEGIEQQIESLKSESEDLQSELEEFRRKTGVPDFEEFMEKLEQRDKKETRIEQHMVKLRTLLDLDDDENLGVMRSTVERGLEDYSDVSVDGDDPEDLKQREEELAEQKKELETKLGEAEKKIESVEDTERSISSELSEIGIPFDQPEELFERKHEWEQELDEAVLDRLSATLCRTVIDRMEGDYLGEIERLLQPAEHGEWSINELYQSVMGTEHEVTFNVDEMTFEIETGDEVIPESALSSGARSHLYFSCRLAVLHQLFPDDPGFIILDDPFLHYFPERKEKVIDQLERFTDAGWQILLFTVDPVARDLFEERLGATVSSVDQLTSATESAPADE